MPLDADTGQVCAGSRVQREQHLAAEDAQPVGDDRVIGGYPDARVGQVRRGGAPPEHALVDKGVRLAEGGRQGGQELVRAAVGERCDGGQLLRGYRQHARVRGADPEHRADLPVPAGAQALRRADHI